VLGAAYRPRPAADLHATVIGLDHPTGDPDLPGLLDDLARDLADAPLTVQFGGFPADDDRLPSRGRSMARRTLTVQGDVVVLIGLPVVGEPPAPSDRLGRIRRGAESRGFRHKYHPPGGPLDPDAYMALGELVAGPHPVLDAGAVRVLARPTRVRLGREDLALVAFTDPALPHATSPARPL
jgi:hypothetical protein